jgi:hypothetical protein
MKSFLVLFATLSTLASASETKLNCSLNRDSDKTHFYNFANINSVPQALGYLTENDSALAANIFGSLIAPTAGINTTDIVNSLADELPVTTDKVNVIISGTIGKLDLTFDRILMDSVIYTNFYGALPSDTPTSDFYSYDLVTSSLHTTAFITFDRSTPFSQEGQIGMEYVLHYYVRAVATQMLDSAIILDRRTDFNCTKIL